MVRLLHKIYEKEINKALDKGDYTAKLIKASRRKTCAEIYLPKKWEGSKVIIIKLD